MKIAFTICSNNYYAQALLLGRSFLLHNPGFEFYIGLVDTKSTQIKYDDKQTRLLEVAQIEKNIYELAIRYNIVELNTAVKPRYFQHFFSIGAQKVIYLDPDIYVYQPLAELDDLLDNYDTVLTPHVLHPIPLDNKTPMESDFLNYGLYNLGFLALKNSPTTKRLLDWWKDRTYLYGYHNLAKGLFVDQLWMNLVPIYYPKTRILLHPGYNMGPWNLHERQLTTEKDIHYVNEEFPLFFYHFSNFKPHKRFELHSVFNRFTLNERPDLAGIYSEYAEKLEQHHFSQYSKIPCHYTIWREEQILKMQEKKYVELPASDKLIRKFKRSMPAGVKKMILTWIQK